jgi:protein-tyrosine phosphatase
MDILFVCHANLCRSPLAERVTRHALGVQSGLRAALSVSSAGTHAEPGMAMHPAARAVLAEAGIDADGFASRPLSAQLLDRAGLVLAVTREQRAVCVTRAPAALRRTFTLRQFGLLARHVDPGRLAPVAPRRRLPALIEEVCRIRDEVLPLPAGEEDLADPVGGTVNEMRTCVGLIHASLRPVFGLLGTGHPPVPGTDSGSEAAPFPPEAAPEGRATGTRRECRRPSR